MSSAKWRPFCLGLSVFNDYDFRHITSTRSQPQKNIWDLTYGVGDTIYVLTQGIWTDALF